MSVKLLPPKVYDGLYEVKLFPRVIIVTQDHQYASKKKGRKKCVASTEIKKLTPPNTLLLEETIKVASSLGTSFINFNEPARATIKQYLLTS